VADSQVHRRAEEWVRKNWLPATFGQGFSKRRLDLRSGGQFEFDGVSDDRKIAALISTNGGVTRSGNKASPKLNKIRSDALFLLLAELDKRLIVFTDRAMFELCQAEVRNGRFPPEIAIGLSEPPPELQQQLRVARAIAADEVSPSSG
jgi:hypothetical protein